ncbi:MAG: hypothetical protein Q7J35_13640 [Candidatus Methanoperedens sp.]|nr:hypothetical protein [Candidatus Methanoperedens sp.]
MRYTREEIQDIADESGQPVVVVKKEEGLTPKQKKILEETKRRHDKAFRRLAQM